LAAGYPLHALGFRLQAIRCRLLAAGCPLLAIGWLNEWLLGVVQKPDNLKSNKRSTTTNVVHNRLLQNHCNKKSRQSQFLRLPAFFIAWQMMRSLGCCC
jgi:hypothetical protein